MNAGGFDRQSWHLLLRKAKVPSCLLRDVAWDCLALTADLWRGVTERPSGSHFETPVILIRVDPQRRDGRKSAKVQTLVPAA
jgi:hypothetical protein